MQQLRLLILIIFTYIAVAGNAYAQAPKQYTLYLTDKNNNSYSLERPQEFLSQRALDRRSRQGISLDETDLPVSPFYLNVLRKDSLKILFTSAWQNTVTIETRDSLFLQTAKKYPFVLNVRRVTRKSSISVKQLNNSLLTQTEAFFSPSIYGRSYRQIAIHNGDELHNLGNRGQGIYVGVLDAGFYKVDSLKAFEQLRQKHKILATHDFVTGDDSVYEDNTHGMYILSIMGGYLEGKLVGTAPEANYFLLRTENAKSEFITEEHAWVAGIEWADSAGADVINSSLGYSLFNDASMNHHYSDMDGKTTPVSLAAGMAAKKGMIVVNSAGNAGTSPWYYITAPADAPDILAVAAIDSNLKVAKFSSRGPSYDGRVKPDVSAIGVQTIVAAVTDGEVIGSNGTSNSAPIITGLVACLWQEFPTRNAFEVMDAVRKSAHLYAMPNDSFGYGIPNFMVARDILKYRTYGSRDFVAQLYPNPFKNGFSLSFYSDEAQTANIYLTDAVGRILWHEQMQTEARGFNKVSVMPNRQLSQGLYIVTVQLKKSKLTAKAIRD